MRNLLTVIVIIVLHSPCLKAQGFLPDSVIYRQQTENTIAYNTQNSNKNAGLYNGTVYVRDYYAVTGHPFFKADSFQKGNVFYDGVLYKNISLLYDLSHDNLITEYSGETRLVFLPGKLRYFTLPGHFFIKPEEYFHTAAPGNGFYDLLLQGKASVLAKRIKIISTAAKSLDMGSVFIQYNSYFIYKDGTYHAVENKNSLLKILSDKKADLKIFIAKNNLDFKKNFESALLQTAGYYNQLTN